MMKCVIFSDRAISSLLTETLEKIDTETGGVFLGYRKGDIWYVVESIDPGPKSIFRKSYFEYDQGYINHLINKVSQVYGEQLDLIGLWHRHPGSFDRFSATDDITNTKYAALDPGGAISALVNIDPTLRLTVFHVMSSPLSYTKLKYAIGNHRFPSELLRYANNANLIKSINSRSFADATSDCNRIFAGPAPAALIADNGPFSLNQAFHNYLRIHTYDQIDNTYEHAVSDYNDDYIDLVLGAIQEDVDYLSSIGVNLRLSKNTSGYIEMTEVPQDDYVFDAVPVKIVFILRQESLLMGYNESLYKYHSGLLRSAYMEMTIEGGQK